MQFLNFTNNMFQKNCFNSHAHRLIACSKLYHQELISKDVKRNLREISANKEFFRFQTANKVLWFILNILNIKVWCIISLTCSEDFSSSPQPITYYELVPQVDIWSHVKLPHSCIRRSVPSEYYSILKLVILLNEE